MSSPFPLNFVPFLTDHFARVVPLTENQQRFARHLIGCDARVAGEWVFAIDGQLPGSAHEGCPLQATRLRIARDGEDDIEFFGFESGQHLVGGEIE